MTAKRPMFHMSLRISDRDYAGPDLNYEMTWPLTDPASFTEWHTRQELADFVRYQVIALLHTYITPTISQK